MTEQEWELLKQWIPLIIPLVIIQWGLMLAALYDLLKRTPEQVKGQKWVWFVVILLVNMIGPIIYFVVGRDEE